MIKDSNGVYRLEDSDKSCEIPAGSSQCGLCGYPIAFAHPKDVDAALEMDEVYVNGTALVITASTAIVRGLLVIYDGGGTKCDPSPISDRRLRIPSSGANNLSKTVVEPQAVPAVILGEGATLTAEQCFEQFSLRQREIGGAFLTQDHLRIGSEQWSAQLRKLSEEAKQSKKLEVTIEHDID